MYDLASESTCLTTTTISQACATQRSGRAGRVQNGFCYRMYPLVQFEAMNAYATPEICRVSLAEVCLKVKMLAINSTIEDFILKAIQSPTKEQISCGIKFLKNINALDSYENMTNLGIHLAHMPIDCALGKAILYALLLRCLDPVLIVVSALSLKDPFLLPTARSGHPIDKIKREFSENSLSDHKMLYNTYTAWYSHTNKAKFCEENSISHSNMILIEGVKTVLMRHLEKNGYITEESRLIQSYNDNALNWPVIKACLTAGLYRKYFVIHCARILAQFHNFNSFKLSFLCLLQRMRVESAKMKGLLFRNNAKYNRTSRLYYTRIVKSIKMSSKLGLNG